MPNGLEPCGMSRVEHFAIMVTYLRLVHEICGYSFRLFLFSDPKADYSGPMACGHVA